MLDQFGLGVIAEELRTENSCLLVETFALVEHVNRVGCAFASAWQSASAPITRLGKALLASAFSRCSCS